MWKARDTIVRRMVALKVLHRVHTLDERARAQFQNEAAAVGKLDHPHIVRLLHCDSTGETAWSSCR